MNTYAGIPAFAAWPAVAFARLPVEAQATASNPNAFDIVSAPVTTRSLNDAVGFDVSSLIQSFSLPSRRPRFSARLSGVNPAPRPMRSTDGPPGRSASYLHSESGP